MTRRIDIGGNQGRNPDGVEVGRHPAQCQQGRVSKAMTNWGLLADEPEQEAAYVSEPLTRVERLVLWLIAATSVAGIGTAVVSCAA
jgi:hypothetical protein